MIFVVDTNIVFSACLTPSGRIFEILFTIPSVQLISCHSLIEELKFHERKLIRLSKLSATSTEMVIELSLKQIDIFDEEIIEAKYWREAEYLTKNVDSNDMSFVALALQTGGVLWTGDKKLINHSRSMGFSNVVTTADLYNLINAG